MRSAIVLFAGLALTGAAHAAPPAVSATASPGGGVAPVRVTLSATGDAATYAWSFGDGATGAGVVVTHIYGVGSFVATVTATNETGEVAEAHVTVTAVARTVLSRTVSLEAPRSAGYDGPAVVAGSLRPAVRGARVQIYRGKTFVTSARVGANGRFRTKLLLRSPGPYHARYGAARSAARTVRRRPRLKASLLAAVPVGSRLTLRPRLVPAVAGSIDVRVLLDGRRIALRAGAVRLPTAKPGRLRVELTARTRPGYAPVRRLLSAQVVLPSLAAGSRFAIHGYPSVPAYLASHGCVRIPLWIAPSLFGMHGYGTTVVVHL